MEFSTSIHPSINVITGTMYSRTLSSVGPRPITIFHDNEAARAKVSKVSILVLMVEVLDHSRMNPKSNTLGLQQQLHQSNSS